MLFIPSSILGIIIYSLTQKTVRTVRIKKPSNNSATRQIRNTPSSNPHSSHSSSTPTHPHLLEERPEKRIKNEDCKINLLRASIIISKGGFEYAMEQCMKEEDLPSMVCLQCAYFTTFYNKLQGGQQPFESVAEKKAIIQYIFKGVSHALDLSLSINHELSPIFLCIAAQLTSKYFGAHDEAYKLIVQALEFLMETEDVVHDIRISDIRRSVLTLKDLCSKQPKLSRDARIVVSDWIKKYSSYGLEPRGAEPTMDEAHKRCEEDKIESLVAVYLLYYYYFAEDYEDALKFDQEYIKANHYDSEKNMSLTTYQNYLSIIRAIYSHSGKKEEAMAKSVEIYDLVNQVIKIEVQQFAPKIKDLFTQLEAAVLADDLQKAPQLRQKLQQDLPELLSRFSMLNSAILSLFDAYEKLKTKDESLAVARNGEATLEQFFSDVSAAIDSATLNQTDAKVTLVRDEMKLTVGHYLFSARLQFAALLANEEVLPQERILEKINFAEKEALALPDEQDWLEIVASTVSDVKKTLHSKTPEQLSEPSSIVEELD
eukprot:TRINITY_DN2892_c0_g1_i1.p1 TRINITY_DN2892_c0_g1~~TRINITY_DN2892_c0_g1_i1.p1  ORF type:complete len:542 (-),score=75.64 TRINITY_DN2892_c0_g1_i1:8-1633(-)